MSNPTEFQSEGFIRDRIICYRNDFKAALKRTIKSLIERSAPTSSIKSRYSDRHAKNLVLQERLAVTAGAPSWFYTAFERGHTDPLTTFSLDWIKRAIPKDGRILVTGCGTGITAFHLADVGFKNIVGIDLLPECITVANRIKQEFGYAENSFFADDCFHPTLTGAFEAITVLHWIYSAWGGNYGNTAVEDGKDPAVRERLLTSFLGTYTKHLNVGGLLFAELVDAVADYRLASDHPRGEFSLGIYPVRFTPEQVQRCAAATGLQVVDYKLCFSYGHQPRTTHVLKKL